MAELVAFSKYSSVLPYATDKPGWVPDAHKDRVVSYQLYTEIYWSHVDASYKVMNRGLDAGDEAVYVPSSRIMIETINRYVAPNLTFSVVPLEGAEVVSDETTLLEAKKAFTDLFARERFESRYAANKREGLIKADWLWHIVADPNKAEGQRISILTVKPENYFPVFEDEVLLGGDPDKLVMVVLAELVQVGDEQQVRTQRYIKTVPEGGGPATITSSTEMWKTDEWFKWRHDDEVKAPIATITPPNPLPVQITQIPVYHIPNTTEVGETFGSSEMRGLEVLQAALNQTATDEDLSVALIGLGVYATEEAGSPMNAAGESVPWFMSPGAVLENAKGLRRVDGLTTLEPYNQHVNRLEGYMGDASGATDAAKGRMEVQEAESGIALQLRLSPTLARAEEKDRIILDVHRQMFYDLATMWFAAFEGKNFANVSVVPALGDKLPVNRAAEVRLMAELVLSNILSAASARKYLASKGFAEMFDVREGELVLAEKVALAAAEGGDSALEDREAQEQPGGEPDDAA